MEGIDLGNGAILLFVMRGKKKNVDYDYLSLMLAFYLASWGMYRGSSFLLKRDYKVHIPVVKEIMKSKYDCLVGIRCNEYRKKEIQTLVFEDLQKSLKEYYQKERLRVSKKVPKKDISETLITKILMGTLSCVPAYDRYFVDGVKKEKISAGNFNLNSILKLADFYEKNECELEKIRKTMRIGKKEYPQMKFLDMAFWQIGYDINNNQTNNRD